MTTRGTTIGNPTSINKNNEKINLASIIQNCMKLEKNQKFLQINP